MSRRDRERERESRNPETKRRRSGFDQEPPPPSPKGDKRSRKGGGEPDAPKSDDGRLRRFHDSMQPLDSDPKPRPEPTEKTNPEDEKKKNKKSLNEERGRNEDPGRVPRFRSFFQHDERGNARQVGRSFGHGAASDRRWRDSKDDQSERTISKSATYNSQRKDEKLHAKEDSNTVWRHDGFSKMEAEDPPMARKRPAFREKKIPIDSENTAPEPVRPSHSDQPVSAGKVREERNNNDPRPVDRSEKPAVGDKRDEHRSSFSSRERYGWGNGNSRGRERFSGRQGYRPSDTWGAKWKHDLFEEGNRSPTMNEEDQIAKVEELLAL